MSDGTTMIEIVWQAQNIGSDTIFFPGRNKCLSDEQGRLFPPNDGSDTSPEMKPGLTTNDLKVSYTIPAGLGQNLYWGRRSNFTDGLDFRIKLKAK